MVSDTRATGRRNAAGGRLSDGVAGTAVPAWAATPVQAESHPGRRAPGRAGPWQTGFRRGNGPRRRTNPTAAFTWLYVMVSITRHRGCPVCGREFHVHARHGAEPLRLPRMRTGVPYAIAVPRGAKSVAPYADGSSNDGGAAQGAGLRLPRMRTGVPTSGRGIRMTQGVAPYAGREFLRPWRIAGCRAWLPRMRTGVPAAMMSRWAGTRVAPYADGSSGVSGG